jgi:hypothetical protein
MMRFRFLILVLAVTFGFVAVKACAGFTLMNPAFVAATAGGGGGGGTSGGGGGEVSPGSPTEYWDMQEASGDRTGEVSGVVITAGGAIDDAAGIQGNAARFPADTSQDLESDYLPEGYDTGGYAVDTSISINFWYKFDTTSHTTFRFPFMTFSGDNDDMISFGINNDEVTAYIESDAGSDSVQHIHTADTSWHMVSIVYDHTTDLMSFYFDGDMVDDTATPTALEGDPFPFIEFNGTSFSTEETRLDELSIHFGTAFTADNVTWIWAGGSGRAFGDF